MTVKFSDAFNRADWVKIGILLVTAAGFWSWVWQAYQEPIFPEGYDTNYLLDDTME